MQSKKNLKVITIIGVVFIILVAGTATFFWGKSGGDAKKNLLTQGTQAVISYRDLQANIIGISQRPYIQLLPKGGGKFDLKLNTLPLSAGDATVRILGTEGAELMGEQKVEFGVFPVTQELAYKTEGAGFLSAVFSGAPSYLVNQNFTYLSAGARSIASPDGRFSVQSEELKAASDLLLLNSAGLPANSGRMVVTLEDPVNPTGASIPVAYQLAASTLPNVTSLTLTFTVDLPEPEMLGDEMVAAELPVSTQAQTDELLPPTQADGNVMSGPTIYAYDQAGRQWLPLETIKVGGTYTATTNKMYDLFALMN